MKRKISITAYFTASVIIAVLLTAIVILFVRTKLTEKNIEDVYISNKEISVSAKYKLETTLNEQISIIKGVEITHHGLIDAGDSLNDDYYELIISQNEYLVGLEILDPSGVILYSSRTTENREGISLANHELVSSVTDVHQQHIGGLVYDLTSESLAIEILYSGEDVIVMGRVSIQYLADFGANFQDTFTNKELMIVDKTGLYIFDSENSGHLIQNRYADIDALLMDSQNNVYVRDINGTESIYSEVEMSEGWHIIIYEDTASGLELLTQNLNYFVLTTVSIVLLMSVIFLAFYIIFLRSLTILGQNFANVKDKNFVTVTDLSIFKEIDALRSNYNAMVSELDYYVQRLKNMAYYDHLTGCPTKQKAQDDFLENESTYDKTYSFIYMDIMRFGIINNNYGYDIGDSSLMQVATILQKTLGTVYRIEGDEFLTIQPIFSQSDMIQMIEKLEASLQENINIFGNKHSFKMKYGVSVYGKDGITFEDLFKKAVIAQESVKNNVLTNYEFYDDSKTQFYERSSKIELIITSALDNEEFYTVYQPIVDTQTKSIRGFEALSRWENEELGFISPDEFIPVLERTRQVHRLDKIVLYNSLRLSKFIDEEFDIRSIASVNISVETIMKDNFVEMVVQALQKFKVDPNLLELEITESTIITDFEKITKKMSYLRNIGIKFSEDDFGDRYSSLTYLSRLKLDTLKISRNFLSSILSNVESRVLVQTILGLSQRLGFFTIVEGVEDEKTYKLFKKYGCDYVQGYYFYKPMKEEQIIELLKNQLREE